MAAPAKEMSDNSTSYFNGICFLSNDDFDYMVATKHAAEEAIGWKLLPENTVFWGRKHEYDSDKMGISTYSPAP